MIMISDDGLSLTDAAAAMPIAQSSKMLTNNNKRLNEDGDTPIIAILKSANVKQNTGWLILSFLASMTEVENFWKMEFWPCVPSW